MFVYKLSGCGFESSCSHLITVKLLKEVCHDVKVKPQFQQLIRERLSKKTAHRRDDTRTDISAFYDIKVFCLNAKRYLNANIQKCYELNEKEKKSLYHTNIERRAKNIHAYRLAS